VALAATWAFLGESRAPGATRLDLGGVALVTVALLLAADAAGARPRGRLAAVVALLPRRVSCPPAPRFFAHQRAITARNGVPLLVLALFRERAFSVASPYPRLLTTLVSFFLTTTLFCRSGWRANALHAALVLLLRARSSSSRRSRRRGLMRRYGHRLLRVGWRSRHSASPEPVPCRNARLMAETASAGAVVPAKPSAASATPP